MPATSSLPGREPKAGPEQVPGALVCLSAAFFCVTVLVFLIRAVSVLRGGQFFTTSGGEYVSMYSVWREMKSLPLYTSPFNPPFNWSQYNYGFYACYAAFLNLLSPPDPKLMNCGRLLTVLFAALGVVAQWNLLRRLLSPAPGIAGIGPADRPATPGWLLSLLCVSCWFNSSLVSWWAMSVRPDIPALALVFCGLSLVSCLDANGRWPDAVRWVAAALAFYLAWFFKQSSAITFLVLVGCLAWSGRTRRRAVLLLSGFALCVVLTWLAGGPEYRASLSKALGVGTWSIKEGALVALREIARNAYVFIPAFFVFQRHRGRHPLVRVLGGATVLSLAVAVVGIMKPGGAGNYLFEPYLAACTLVILLLLDPTLRPRKAVYCAILLAAVAYPLIQVGAWALHISTPWLLEHTAAERADAHLLARKLASAPKPALAPEMLSLPWFSTDGQYPAYVLDPVLISAAEDAHLLAAGGIRGMIRRREFASILTSQEDYYFDEPLRAGYIEQESFSAGGQMLFLYIRPQR